MHILLVHQAFAALDEPGGTRHHELARLLAGRGHRVTVIASPVSYLTGEASGRRIPWAKQEQTGPGVTVVRAYTYPGWHRSFVHRVISFLSFTLSSFIIGLGIGEVDLVWGTSPQIFQGLTAWGLARLKRAPFLFEVRDLWPAFAVAVGVLRNPLLIRASQGLESFLYHRADRIVVNSPGFVDHVASRGASGIEVVPNGADTSMFDPQARGETFRRRHNLEGRFIVLYAGAHGMSNDLEVLLEAAQMLGKHPEIAIVFLGDGKEKPALVERAQRMGLKNVLFLPAVPKNHIPQALAAADACVAILKPIEQYKTVYPNKVFDYMAAGRPVVLAIDGVIREVVERAGAGIPVPPGEARPLVEALLTLKNDPAICQEMGRRGRDYVTAHFDRSLSADKMAEIMERLVDKRG
jgi:glycosyltransferase involved in cell wall biosynthesis